MCTEVHTDANRQYSNRIEKDFYFTSNEKSVTFDTLFKYKYTQYMHVSVALLLYWHELCLVKRLY